MSFFILTRLAYIDSRACFTCCNVTLFFDPRSKVSNLFVNRIHCRHAFLHALLSAQRRTLCSVMPSGREPANFLAKMATGLNVTGLIKKLYFGIPHPIKKC